MSRNFRQGPSRNKTIFKFLKRFQNGFGLYTAWIGLHL